MPMNAAVTANRGFTLIEVLVTLVILLFGLLGIAGLIIQGQRAAYEAYQRQQALAMASDMAERMKANPTQGGAYADLAKPGTEPGAGSVAVECKGSSSCLTATSDVAAWRKLLSGALESRGDGTGSDKAVGGVIDARGCVEPVPPVPGDPPLPAPSARYRVSVTWQGKYETAAPPERVEEDGSACGVGIYGKASLRRLVSLDLIVP